MKKVLAYVMLVLFLATSFNHLAILGLYVLNQDFITAKFCVNKDKPDMQCKGKCHLADMMTQVEDRNEEKNMQVNTSFILPVYQDCSEIDWPEVNTSTEHIHDQELLIYSSYTSGIFHPPQLV